MQSTADFCAAAQRRSRQFLCGGVGLNTGTKGAFCPMLMTLLMTVWSNTMVEKGDSDNSISDCDGLRCWAYSLALVAVACNRM